MAMPDRIFLVGPRGCGKTTVARLLAESVDLDSADADIDLQDVSGMSIQTIFEQEGEAGFRRRESEMLRLLVEGRSHFAIATGGGVVLLKENRDLMKASGRVIWLTADVETLWQRISGDPATAEQRPVLTVGGREEVAQVVAAREPLYRAVADHVVDTTHRLPEEVAADILAWLTQPERERPADALPIPL